jgi:uncharacterized membrane protein
MEFVFVLFFVIVILLILFSRYTLSDKMDRLEREILRLREEVKARAAEAPRPVAPPVQSPVQSPLTPPGQPPVTPPPSAAAPQPPKEMEPYRPIPRPVQTRPTPAPAPGPTPTPPVRPEKRVPEKAPAEPTDWEKFVGENLISKIGIAILVLAIGFFVKYAIDNDWIGPVGRVAIGLLCGGILIAVAHRLRNQYKAFSSVLIGGGLAVLYFTIALAYHQYQLFAQPTAFILMLIITAFSVALSLLYNREELAIIALLGGFVTPFLVSSGSGDYKVLFTYLLILNTGLLVIAYHKAWRLLNGLAFAFTVVLFGSWLIRLPAGTGQPVYYGGAAFATAFYGLFFVAAVARTIREKKKFIAVDFLILLLNTCLYFGVSLYLLSVLGLERYKGLYCAIMGVNHIVLSWLLFRRQSVDKNILYLLIGITLSFVSLTAPLQLHGHYITMFWATEAVLLYWLFLKSKLRLIGVAAGLVLAAMLVSLAWDWVNIYLTGSQALPIVFNKGFMTGLFCTLACYILFRLQSETGGALVMLFAAAAMLYVSGALEIGYQFGHRYSRPDIDALFLLPYTWLFITLFTAFNGQLKVSDFRVLNMALLGLALFVYLISLPGTIGLQEDLLAHRSFPGFFTAHWVGASVVLFILYRLTTLYRRGSWKIEEPLFAWSVAIIAVIFLSAEGQMLVNLLFYSPQHPLDELQRVYEKTGLPILWGLCSFVCMWLGMRHKFRPLRIFSLVLFLVTLLKLFLFDIRDIPIAGKIAAFFSLGVLLLVVSFMYQRLKKIIIDNEAKIPE